MGLKIGLVSHREKAEELANLFRISFGHDISLKHWEWKYLKNPLTETNPQVIVAEQGGKIIGARPLMLSEIRVNTEKLLAAQPCDTMVHPEYQRQGIFARMNQFAIEHSRQSGYTLFYNFPNSSSFPAYIKSGWQKVSSTENLLRIINPRKLAHHKFSGRLTGKAFEYLCRIFLKEDKKNPVSPESYQLKTFDHFASELKQLDLLRDPAKIELVRSEDYLKWRLDRHPEHQYRYMVVKKEDTLSGYAVISTGDTGQGLIVGKIIDYLIKDYNPECFRILIHACLEELKKNECSLVSVGSSQNPYFRQELISSFNFKSSLGFPCSLFFEKGSFVARHVNDRVLRKTDIYNREKWNITDIYRDGT